MTIELRKNMLTNFILSINIYSSIQTPNVENVETISNIQIVAVKLNIASID